MNTIFMREIMRGQFKKVHLNGSKMGKYAWKLCTVSFKYRTVVDILNLFGNQLLFDKAYLKD